jgi:hypothetical protein
MSKVQLQGNVSGTGVFTIASPNSNTDRTLTLPDNSGTVLTSSSSITQNSGPAFSAYPNAATSLTNNAYTKVLFQVEEYDANSNYDTSNSRFTPTVAGYYQISSSLAFATSQTTECVLEIYKNGTNHEILQDLRMTNLFIFSGSALVYANGTTDYFEIYAYQSQGAALNTNTGLRVSRFQGVLVRAA